MFCALIYVSAILIIVEPLSPCKPRGTCGGRWMLRCWGLNGEKDIMMKREKMICVDRLLCIITFLARWQSQFHE